MENAVRSYNARTRATKLRSPSTEVGVVTTKQRQPDVIIFAAVVALLAIGIVVVMSAASVRGLIQFDDPYYHFKRQLLWAVIGLVAMIVLSRIDYRFFRLAAVPLLGAGFVLLILVLFIGVETGGARRWLSFGIFNLQPSELMKFALINYLSAFVATRRGEMRNFFRGFLPSLAVVGAAAGLILLEPDFGTAVTLGLTGVLVLFAGGVQLGQMIMMGLAAAPVVYFLARSEAYRLRRLTAFLDPWADKMDTGWNIVQSLLAIGSGGVFGLGLGEGRQKYLYVPEQHTDFIFSILGEELGFVGGTVVLLLFTVLAWRGFRAALQAPDLYGCVLAVGITCMIVFQALLNIAVVTGSIPTTGITLPFVSFGGSSLVVTLAAVGILLNISSHGTRA